MFQLSSLSERVSAPSRTATEVTRRGDRQRLGASLGPTSTFNRDDVRRSSQSPGFELSADLSDDIEPPGLGRFYKCFGKRDLDSILTTIGFTPTVGPPIDFDRFRNAVSRTYWFSVGPAGF